MTHDYRLVDTFLKDFVGLDPAATPGVMERAVDRILQDRPELGIGPYVNLLRHSDKELDILLQQMLVAETWFFRYPEAFHFLQHWILSTWMKAHKHEQLKVLSVPCSTGEEPYSIAMTLLDVGLSDQQFVIHAADISFTALQSASNAVYSQNSFRGTDLSFRHNHFQKSPEGYKLNQNVVSTVKFFQWNVQKAPPPEIKTSYDIIFCRNLFIYFHREAQQKMISTLNRLLATEGLLFVGHAEAGAMLAPRFKSVLPLNAFAHRKS